MIASRHREGSQQQAIRRGAHGGRTSWVRTDLLRAGYRVSGFAGGNCVWGCCGDRCSTGRGRGQGDHGSAREAASTSRSAGEPRSVLDSRSRGSATVSCGRRSRRRHARRGRLPYRASG
ncbi:hypothetical protein emb_1d0405 [Coriobacteriaceae bacterium EMTCatB1]|nr:hypothetical protein emb_1d0405 [Coriobacteriaceae bacterium EMTCatB1]